MAKKAAKKRAVKKVAPRKKATVKKTAKKRAVRIPKLTYFATRDGDKLGEVYRSDLKLKLNGPTAAAIYAAARFIVLTPSVSKSFLHDGTVAATQEDRDTLLSKLEDFADELELSGFPIAQDTAYKIKIR